ncbi:MAG: hypothetical protein ACKO0N_08305 [Planctomycetota bacterium]|jgi:hypothetical protein
MLGDIMNVAIQQLYEKIAMTFDYSKRYQQKRLCQPGQSLFVNRTVGQFVLI